MRVSPADNDSPRNLRRPSVGVDIHDGIETTWRYASADVRRIPVPTGDSVRKQCAGNASRVAMLDWPDLEQAMRGLQTLACCASEEIWHCLGSAIETRIGRSSEGRGRRRIRKEPSLDKPESCWTMLGANRIVPATRGSTSLMRSNVARRKPHACERRNSRRATPFWHDKSHYCSRSSIIALGRPAAQVLLNREIRSPPNVAYHTTTRAFR